MTSITQEQYETIRDGLLNGSNNLDLTLRQDGTEYKNKLAATQTIMDIAWENHQKENNNTDAMFMDLILPLTRLVVPNLAAWELIGVQPIKKDVDLIHSLQVRYMELDNDKITNE